MLKTACILDDTPGYYRVCVMSRLTLDDGQTPDERLDGRYDEHWPELGPPPKLIGSYLRGEITWDEYVPGYLVHLQRQSEVVERLVKLALDQNVAILCIEPDEEDYHCHRRLLSNYIRTHWQGQSVVETSGVE